MPVVEEASDLLLHGSKGAPCDPTLWYLDKGATNHMTRRWEFFRSIDKSMTGFVKFGDNSKIRIKGRGDIEITQKDGKVLRFPSVLYVPNLTANILSLGRLDEEGCCMTMARGKLTILASENRLLALVQRSEGRLYLPKLNVVDQCLIITEDSPEGKLWHLRYGHLNFHSIKFMSRMRVVEGLPQIDIPDQLCRSCVAGKQHRSSFPKGSLFRASKPLELVHVDICEPISPSTLGGSRYFLLIVDDFCRLMWISMLKSKSDALTEFKHFKVLAEAEQDTHIKCLRSDKGGEFTSEAFADFCTLQGIKRQLTAPYSPQ